MLNVSLVGSWEETPDKLSELVWRWGRNKGENYVFFMQISFYLCKCLWNDALSPSCIFNFITVLHHGLLTQKHKFYFLMRFKIFLGTFWLPSSLWCISFEHHINSKMSFWRHGSPQWNSRKPFSLILLSSYQKTTVNLISRAQILGILSLYIFLN